jgi:hypothetical protein
LALSNVDLDTGSRPARRANPLADETYVDLLAELAGRNFAGVPSALRRDINEHYASRSVPRAANRKVRKQERKAAQYLTRLNASSAGANSRGRSLARARFPAAAECAAAPAMPQRTRLYAQLYSRNPLVMKIVSAVAVEGKRITEERATDTVRHRGASPQPRLLLVS